ncbi:hypothetical protein VHEMI09404 [[Torrubiella] hemipterigena]|uniref:Uncharacterized protein n=1 Tax=[Torrubiella] hemipterigena TaxID=1531966 RepID=A0A0A1TRF6_9HYPO|nr:hypothetical protein VHEMI09404 [[Torrubiella] hemipterigena]
MLFQNIIFFIMPLMAVAACGKCGSGECCVTSVKGEESCEALGKLDGFCNDAKLRSGNSYWHCDCAAGLKCYGGTCNKA